MPGLRRGCREPGGPPLIRPFRLLPRASSADWKRPCARKAASLQMRRCQERATRGVSWLNSLRLSWDDLNYQWQRRVLNFRSEEQLALFRTLAWHCRLAADRCDCPGAGVYPMAVQAFFWLRPARRTGTPAQRAWQQLDRRLRPLGLGAQAGEGPRDWQQRIGCALPSQADLLAAFFDCFVAQEYAGGNADARCCARTSSGCCAICLGGVRRALPVKRRLL